MIARIRGELLERSVEEIVVDVGGVGYRLLVTLNTLARIGDPGSQVDLHVHTQVREDAITLYGFATAPERSAYRLLVKVSGIGPRLARSMLSTMSPQGLAEAIWNGDLQALSRVPGIGKRMAERIVVELRDSFPDALMPDSEKVGQGERPASVFGPPRVLRDLELALLDLGFRSYQVRKVLKQLEPAAAGRSLEDLVRDALDLLRGPGR